MRGPMFLNSNDAVKVHAATLKVLEDTGIRLDNGEAEALLLSAGASKDAHGRIRIPRALVERSLENANSKIRLWNRDRNVSILLRNGRTYFAPGSDALYAIDRENQQLRPSTLEDVKENVCVADALSGFDFVMSMGLPREIAPHKLYATIFATMLKNTDKPLIVTATCLEDIKQMHMIATILAGQTSPALLERPHFIAYLEPISPLRFERSEAERLLYCAEYGIPFVFAAGANCGSGAPITPEGGVVQGSAESLAGLVLALLKHDNARFIYGSNTSVMDMRTSVVAYGAPEWFRTVAMYADMGKHYDLPSWGTAGCSDSFCIDAQAAMEAYEGILMALQSGTSLAHDVGFLAHGALYDARMLVLTDEMIKRAKHLLKPVDLSDSTLATDVIDEVARKNSLYLAHQHTADIFRETLWLAPPFINRRSVVKAEEEGGLARSLSQRVKEILNVHKPPTLPPDREKAIDDYLASL